MIQKRNYLIDKNKEKKYKNFYKRSSDLNHNLNWNWRQPLFWSLLSMNWNDKVYVPEGAKLGIKFLYVNSIESPDS